MKAQELKKALRHLGGGRTALTIAAISALISAFCSLAAPRLIGLGIDAMTGPEAGRAGSWTLGLALAFLIASYLAGVLFSWLLGKLTNDVSYLTARNLRRELFAKLGGLPLSFFDSTAQGDTISRFVNDVDAVTDGLLQGFAQFLSGIATIIGAAVFMLSMSLPMALLVIVLTPLSVFTARFVAKSSRSRFRDQASIVGQLSAFAEESIEGRREMKAFRLENAYRSRFETLDARLYEAGVKAQFYSSLANPATRLVNNIAYCLVGVAGCLLAIKGGLSVGGISSFLIYATLFAKPFNDITNVMTQLQSAAASARRIASMLDLPEEVEGEGRSKPDCRGAIRFEKADFSYDKNRRLIEGLQLDIPYGTSVAIVGKTGAGKTTIVNLLMRFYDVDKGRITIGGADIRDFLRDDLRRSFGMVLQDTWLFRGSIRDNIAYSKPEAGEEEIRAAAREAGASFIERLPLGFDTMIGASGEGLSQGERQLVTIARVMLADPPIFILDEATSSIDTETELRVQAALKKLTRGRTSFVIAHRLSTIRGSDLILVLDGGKIVESGSHETLLEKNGFYAAMYRSRLESELETAAGS